MPSSMSAATQKSTMRCATWRIEVSCPVSGTPARRKYFDAMMSTAFWEYWTGNSRSCISQSTLPVL